MKTPPLRSVAVVTMALGLFFSIFISGSDNRERNPTASLSQDLAPNMNVRFSSSPYSPAGALSFDSPEFIYARLQFDAPQYGAHTLEGTWIRPDGTPQEFTRVELDFGEQGGVRAYLWLQFHDNDDGTLPLNFRGVWKLHASLNGRQLVPSTFSVS